MWWYFTKIKIKKKNLLIITKLKNKKEYNSYNKEKELEKSKKLNLKKLLDWNLQLLTLIRVI